MRREKERERERERECRDREFLLHFAIPNRVACKTMCYSKIHSTQPKNVPAAPSALASALVPSACARNCGQRNCQKLRPGHANNLAT